MQGGLGRPFRCGGLLDQVVLRRSCFEPPNEKHRRSGGKLVDNASAGSRIGDATTGVNGCDSGEFGHVGAQGAKHVAREEHFRPDVVRIRRGAGVVRRKVDHH